VFEQTLIPSGKTGRPWTVVVAFLGQLGFVGILLLIPILFVETLPVQDFMSVLVMPSPPPPPPPPPLPVQVKVAKVTRATRVFDPSRLMAPQSIPKEIAILNEPELAPQPAASGVVGGVPGGMPGGQIGGVIGGILGAVPTPPPPPPPAEKPAPKAATPQQVKVSGEIEAGMLVHQVQPDYPSIARTGRVEGTVRLQAVIGRDGRVRSLTLISGQPLFVQSAIDAVKQWVYKPTFLNGEAVEVLTEINVNFHMVARH
jgi:periplasmic protein TonB